MGYKHPPKIRNWLFMTIRFWQTMILLILCLSYFITKDFHANFLLIFLRTFVKVKFPNIGTFSMFLNKFGISGTIKRSGIQYIFTAEKSAHFLAHPKTFLHAHILGGILSQNFIASTAPIHFPFCVLFLQNHLPTHSSRCTLLVLTIFFHKLPR